MVGFGLANAGVVGEGAVVVLLILVAWGLGGVGFGVAVWGRMQLQQLAERHSGLVRRFEAVKNSQQTAIDAVGKRMPMPVDGLAMLKREPVWSRGLGGVGGVARVTNETNIARQTESDSETPADAAQARAGTPTTDAMGERPRFDDTPSTGPAWAASAASKSEFRETHQPAAKTTLQAAQAMAQKRSAALPQPAAQTNHQTTQRPSGLRSILSGAGANLPGAGAGVEAWLGTRMFVWVGGLALLLAGAFFVKHALDHDWLPPVVRVTLGLLFGAGLCGAGLWVKEKAARVDQALAGAGVGVLLATVFAGTQLHALWPAVVGFVGMGLVTGLGVWLGLRLGVGVAVLGMLGGFATPLLVGGDDIGIGASVLHLLLLQWGIQWVARRKAWPLLTVGATALSVLWALWFMGVRFDAADRWWLHAHALGTAGLAWWQGNGPHNRPRKEKERVASKQPRAQTSGSGWLAAGQKLVNHGAFGFALAMGLETLAWWRGGFATAECVLMVCVQTGWLLFASLMVGKAKGCLLGSMEGDETFRQTTANGWLTWAWLGAGGWAACWLLVWGFTLVWERNLAGWLATANDRAAAMEASTLGVWRLTWTAAALTVVWWAAGLREAVRKNSGESLQTQEVVPGCQRFWACVLAGLPVLALVGLERLHAWSAQDTAWWPVGLLGAMLLTAGLSWAAFKTRESRGTPLDACNALLQPWAMTAMGLSALGLWAWGFKDGLETWVPKLGWSQGHGFWAWQPWLPVVWLGLAGCFLQAGMVCCQRVWLRASAWLGLVSVGWLFVVPGPWVLPLHTNGAQVPVVFNALGVVTGWVLLVLSVSAWSLHAWGKRRGDLCGAALADSDAQNLAANENAPIVPVGLGPVAGWVSVLVQVAVGVLLAGAMAQVRIGFHGHLAGLEEGIDLAEWLSHMAVGGIVGGVLAAATWRNAWMHRSCQLGLQVVTVAVFGAGLGVLTVGNPIWGNVSVHGGRFVNSLGLLFGGPLVAAVAMGWVWVARQRVCLQKASVPTPPLVDSDACKETADSNAATVSSVWAMCWQSDAPDTQPMRRLANGLFAMAWAMAAMGWAVWTHHAVGQPMLDRITDMTWSATQWHVTWLGWVLLAVLAWWVPVGGVAGWLQSKGLLPKVDGAMPSQVETISRHAWGWWAWSVANTGLLVGWLFLHNPLWADTPVLGVAFFNSLWLLAGVPMACIGWQLRLAMQGSSKPSGMHDALRTPWQPMQKTLAVGMALSIWWLVVLLVRQSFHGRDLGLLEGLLDAENLAHTASWLVLGTVWLGVGIWRQHRLCRMASLVLMVAAVFKVFLFDMAGLDGLARVFSFMGLGVSLIGLGVVYQRFVFGNKRRDALGEP